MPVKSQTTNTFTGGANSSLGTPGNWTNGLPTAGQAWWMTTASGTITDDLGAGIWSGGITFGPTAGALTMSAGTNSTLTLGGNLINLSGVTDTFTTSLNIVLTSSLNVVGYGANSNFLIAGVISDGGAGLGLSKYGSGTMTLTGQNTYTGATTLNAGVLALDFVNAQAGTTATGIINSNSALQLNGGTLRILGATTGTSQTFNGVTSAAGFATLSVTGGAGGTTVSLGTVTHNAGGVLNFSLGGTSPTITTSNANLASGILGGGYVIGLNDFATITTTGNKVSTFTGYNTATSNLANWVATPNVVMSNSTTQWSGSLTGNVTEAGVQFANNSVGALSLQGNILTLNDGNGVGTLLITSTVSGKALTISGASGSALTAGTTGGGELIIINNGLTATTLSVNTSIADNGSGVVDVVYLGTGTGSATLSGVNTYSGGTYIEGGTLNVIANSGLGNVASGATVTLNGGVLGLVGTSNFTLDNSGVNARGVFIGANGGTIATTSVSATINTYTVDGSISGASVSGAGQFGAGALTKAGTGVLVLSGVNSYAGGTIIAAGTLGITSDSSLGAVPTVTTNNITFSAASTLQFQNSGINLSANRGISVANAIAVTFSGGTHAVTVGGNITGGGTSSISALTSGTLNFLGSITGTSGFTTTLSTGTVTLSQGYGGTGTLTLASGVTVAALQSIAGAGNNLFLITGSSLISATNSAQTFGTVTVNTGSGTILAAGNMTFSGITSTVTVAKTLTLSGPVTFNVAGNITNTISVAVVGGGTLSFTGATSVFNPGATAVPVLTIGNSSSVIFNNNTGAGGFDVSRLGGAGTVSLGLAGGTLNFNTAAGITNNTLAFNSMTLTGASTLNFNSSAAATVSGTLSRAAASGGTLNITNSGTLGGGGVGSQNVVFNGLASQFLNGLVFVNGTSFATYSGTSVQAFSNYTTTVGGQIQGGSGAVYNITANGATSPSGTVSLSGLRVSNGITVGPTDSTSILSFTGLGGTSLSGNVGGLISFGGNNTISAPIMWGATTAANADLTIRVDGNTNSLTVSNLQLATGGIAPTTGSLTKVGAGTLDITGTMGFSGSFLIMEGTAAFAGTGNQVVSSSLGIVTLNVAAGATLAANNQPALIGNLTGGGTIQLGTLVGAQTFTVGVNNTGSTWTGSFANSGGVGTVQLVKVGTGSQTFGGSLAGFNGGLSLTGNMVFTGTASQFLSGDLSVAGSSNLTFTNLLNSTVTLGNLTLSTGAAGTQNVFTFNVPGRVQFTGSLTETGNGTALFRGPDFASAGGTLITFSGVTGGTALGWAIGDTRATGSGQGMLTIDSTTHLLRFFTTSDIAPSNQNSSTMNSASTDYGYTTTVTGIGPSTGLANSLTIDNGSNSNNSILVSGGGGTLTITTGDVQFLGSGTTQSATISGFSALQLGGSATNWNLITGNAGSTITIGSVLAGAAGTSITKVGPGALNFSADQSGTVPGSASFLGSVLINEGTLSLQNANALTAANAVTLNSGTFSIASGLGSVNLGLLTASNASSFLIGSNDTVTLSNYGASTVNTTLGATSTLSFGSNNIAATVTGAFTLGANSTVIKLGTAAFTYAGVIAGTAASNSVLQINGIAGAFDMSTNNATANITNTNIVINPGSTFLYTGTNSFVGAGKLSGDQFALHAATAAFSQSNTTNGGNLITGAPIIADWGTSFLTLTQGSTIGSTLSATALTRNNDALLVLNGQVATITGLASGAFLNVFATSTAPTVVNGGYQTSPTSGSQGIIPWMLFDQTSTGIGNTLTGLMTYSTSVGLRPLSGTDLMTTSSTPFAALATGPAFTNLVINSAVSQTLAAPATLSALVMSYTTAVASSLTLSGVTLTIQNGVLINQGVASTISGSAGSFLTFGSGNTSETVAGANQGIIYTNAALVLSATISDAGATPVQIVKAGTSILTLSSANAYSGGTMIEGGTIQLTNANGLGTGGLTFAGNSSWLTIRALAVIADLQSLSLSGAQGLGNVTTTQLGQINSTVQTLTLGGGLAGTANATFGGTFVNSNALTLSVDMRTFTQTFTGLANNFSGGLRLISGTLAVPSDLSMGAAGTATTFSGGTLRIFSQAGATFSLSPSRTINIDGVTGGTIDVTGVTATIESPIKDSTTSAGILTITGPGGTLFLDTSASTFNGGVTVTNGAVLHVTSVASLSANNSLTLGGSSAAIFDNPNQQLATVTNSSTAAAGLSFSASSGTNTLAGLIGTGTSAFNSNAFITGSFGGGSAVVTGSATIGTFSTSGTLTLAGPTSAATITTLTGSGTIRLGSGATSLTVNGNAGIFGGAIHGAGSLVVSLSGSTPVLQLTGGSALDYIGATNVNVGTLSVVSLAATNAITVASGANFSVTTTSANGLPTTAPLTNSGTTTFAGSQSLANLLGGSSGILSVAASNTLTLSAASYAGNITGAGAVNFNGASSTTYTMSASNSDFSGGTTLSAGTLFVTGGAGGSALGTGTIILSSGTAFASGGAATISGPLSMSSGSTVYAGNSGTSVLSLTGGLTAAGGSTFSFVMNGSNSVSSINLGASTLTISSGTVTINLTGSGLNAGEYPLFTYNSALGIGTNSGTLALNAGLPSNYQLDYSHPGLVDLQIISVGSTLTWSSATSGAAVDGTGTWNLASNNFVQSDNLTHQAWPNTLNDTVIFGAGNVGDNLNVVTLAQDTTLKQIVFNALAGQVPYTVTGNNNLLLYAGGIVASNSATIGAPIITQATQLWSVVGGKTLTVGGAVGAASAGLGLTLTGPGTIVLSGTSTFANTLAIDGLATVSITGTMPASAISIASGSTLAVSGALTPTVNLADEGTFTVASNITVGSLSGAAGIVQLTGTNTLTLSGGSFGGAIGGAGNLAVAGNVTLGGINTFSGATTVSSGILLLTNSLALQNSTVQSLVANGLSFSGISTATLGGLSGSANQVLTNAAAGAVALRVGNNGATTSYGGVLSGVGSLEKDGGGTFTLAGANLYSGATTVTGGLLVIDAAGSINNSTNVTISNSGALTVNNALNSSTVLVVNNSGVVTFSVNQTLGNLLGSFSGAAVSVASTKALTLSTGIFAGAINGSGNLVTVGNTTLSNPVNGLSGTLTVNAGGLTLNGSIGATSVTVAPSSTLNVTTNTANALTALPSLTMGNSSTVTLAGSQALATLTGSGTLSLSSGKLLTLNGAGSFNGVISGAGSGVQINPGVGNLVNFAGVTNGYGGQTGGGTTLQSGILRIGADLSLGLAPTSAITNITFSGNSTLQFNAAITESAFRTTTIQNGVTATFDSQANAVTVAGIISGPGTFVKAGATGTITLSSAANAYAGGTTVSAGTLVATSPNGYGSGAITLAGGVLAPRNSGTQNNGTINYGYNLFVQNTSTISVNIATGGAFTGNTIQFGALTLSSGVTLGMLNGSSYISQITGQTTLLGSATITATAPVLLGAIAPSVGVITPITLTLSSNGTNVTTISGAVSDGSGPSSLALAKLNPGTLFLSTSNNYSGGTTIAGGIVQIGDGGALGSGMVTFSGAGATLDLTGSNLTAANVASIGTVGSITNSGAAAVLTLNGPISGSYGGTINDGAGTTGLGVALNGATLTLSGTNGFTGGLTLTSGVLAAASGANLGGAAGQITFAGGTLALANGFTGLQSRIYNINNVAGNKIDITGAQATISGQLTGAGGLTVAGAGGILTLSGNNVGYTGDTNLTTGTLVVANASGVALGSGNVTVGSAMLASSGTSAAIAGNVTLGSLSAMSVGNGSIGTLSIGGNLSATGGTFLFALSTGNNSSLINLGGTLTLNNVSLSLSGATPGTYTLINGDTTGASFSSVIGLGSLTYSEAIVGNALQLTLQSAAVATTLTWSATTTGLSDGPGLWVDTTTNAAATNFWNGATNVVWDNTQNSNAAFGNGGTGGTVSLGSNIAVNQLIFNTVTTPYTINGNGFALTLAGGIAANNSATVSAPITLSASQTWTVTTGAVLGVTQTISEATAGLTLTLTGTGTTALLGTNSYSGGTVINGGTVQINSSTSLGLSSGLATINAATLEATQSIATTRNFSLGNAASAILVDTGTYSIGGAISGAGALNVYGSGTLFLANGNSYGGGTVINGGTVQINGSTSLGLSSGLATINAATLEATQSIATTRNFSLGNAASAILVDAGTYSIGGAISGAGALNVYGSGTLFLANGNSYGGGTVINGGTVQINGSTSLGLSSGLATINAATLEATQSIATTRNFSFGNAASAILVDTGTYSIGGAISGAGALNVYGAGTLFLANGNSYGGGTVINGGTVQINGSTSLGLSSGLATINAGTLEATQSIATTRNFSLGNAASAIRVDTGTYSIGGAISGAGALNVYGLGTLFLANGNSYGGGTVINGSTVQINGSTSLGLSSGLATINAGTLEATQSIATTRNFSLGNAASAILVDTGTYSIGGAISGAGALNVYGTGTLFLANGNSYGGGTVINGGIVQINGSTSLGLESALATINAATLEATQSIATTRNFSLGNSASAIRVDTGTYSIGGTISGAGGLNVYGSGTLVLASGNSYGGGTIINGGAVTAQSATALGTGAVTVNNGAVLNVTTFTGNVLTVSGNMTLNSGATVGLTVGASTINLSSHVLNLSSGTETISLAGTISSAGDYLLLSNASTINSAGATLALNTTNLAGSGFTYSLLTTSSQISLHVVSAVGPTGNLTWNGASGQPWDVGTTQNWIDNTLNVAFANGNTVTFTDTGAGTVNITTSGVLPANTTFNNSGVNTYTLAGGSIGGSGGLQKLNTGTLVITNNNTYTGATTITAGVVTVVGSGALANTSGVTVSGTFNLTTSGNALGSAVPVTVTTGGVLNISTSQSIASLFGSGGTAGVASGAVLTLGGGSYGGILNGAGAVTIAAGANTVTFGGTGAYTGGTTVSTGTLQVLNAASLASGGNVTVSGAAAAIFANSPTLGTVTNSSSATTGLSFLNTATISQLAGTGTSSFGAAATVTQLIGSGTITFSSTANVTTFANGIATIVGAGTFGTIGSGQATFNNTASITTLSGGNVSVAGIATIGSLSGNTTALTLSGATGSITSLSGSGTITLTGTALSLSGGSFGGVVKGSGSVTVVGNTTFTGTNAYTGVTTVNSAASLNVLSSGSLASGNNLTINSVGAATFANVQSLGTVSNAGSLTFTGATATIASLGGAGGLTLSGTNLSVTGGGNYSGTLNNGASPGHLTVAGATLTLSGVDNLTGGITIQSSAILAAAAASALGNNALSFTGGTLHVTGNIHDSAALVNINGSGGTFNIDSGATLTLTGANITGNLTQAGAGTLVILGAYTGTTTVQNNGTFQANPTSTGNVVLNNGSVLDFTSSGIYNGTITVSSGTAIIENTSGGIVTISGTVDKTHTNLILEGPGFFWINGQIVGGTPGVDFNSDLTITTNTTYSTQQVYSGPTTISSNATVWLQTNNALPTNTIVNLGETVSNTTGLLNIGSSTQTLAGIVAWGTGIGNEITSTAAGNLFVNVASSIDSYSGKLTGGVSLAKEGAGTLALTGTSNSYTGATTIDAGTLQVGVNNALPTTTTVSLTGTGTLDLLNHTQQIVALLSTSSTATVTGSGGTLTVSHSASVLSSAFAGAISGTLNVSFGGASGAVQTLSGTSNYVGSTTVDTGVLLVNGSIVNNGGAGTLVTVNSGTLGGTGTIERNMSISSAGTISPGVDSTTPATLTVGNSSTATSVAISGTYHYDLHIADTTQVGSSSTHDQISMLGTSQTLTLNSGSTLSLALSSLPNGNAYWTANHVWALVTGSALLTSGTFTTLTDGTNTSTLNHLGGYSGTNGFFSVDYGTANALQLDWNATAVPEPGTMLLATLASLGLGGYGWRKRKSKRANGEAHDAEDESATL